MRARAVLAALGSVAALTLAACGASTAGTGGTSSGTTSTSGQTGTTGTGGTSTGTTSTGGQTGTTSSAGSGSTAASSPTTTLAGAIAAAYTMEQLAHATYEAVIARIGAVAPFTNVAASEAQHIATVARLAQEHAVTLPAGPFTAPAVPSTRTAACQLGVTTEQTVAAAYTPLIPVVRDYPDVANAFSTLQQAARDSHLPAFEHCA